MEFQELQLELIQAFSARLQKLGVENTQFKVQNDVMYFRIKGKGGIIHDYAAKSVKKKFELLAKNPRTGQYELIDELNEKKIIKYLTKENC